MNFCPKCGGQLNGENLQFCPVCGAILASQQEAVPPQYGMQMVSPAVKTIKKLGASPMYLAAIISFSLVALLTFIASFGNHMDVINMVLRLIVQYSGMGAYEIAELYDAIGEYLGVIKAANVISAIFSLIPTIIVAIGLWLIYANSIKPDYAKFSTAGFTTIKVMNIISLVGACLIAVVLFIVTIVGTIASVVGEVEELAFVFGIGIVVTLIVSAVIIVYYCKIIKSLNMATRSVKDNIPYPNASRFVGIICFAGALGAFFGIFTLSIIGIIQAILSVAQMVIFGILVFKYRKEMNAAVYGNQFINQ